jgi:hypothetical protein
MCVSIFSTILFETFLILRRNKRDIVINVKTSSSKVPVILVEFKWNWNFLDRFSKILNIKFHQNPSRDSRVVSWGQKDEHDKAISRFSQFFERD